MWLLLCTFSLAQTNISAPAVSSDVAERVQRQVRAYFNIPPDVSISLGSPKPSEFPNYELVPVTMSRDGKTQNAEFLLSNDGKTLIRYTKIDLTKDIYAETMDKITMTGRPVRGNPDAKVTVVNFDDFECPFCARMHSTLMGEILPEYKDKIKIVYKDFPLVQIHPWAQHAANDANCLAAQSGTAYWQLADYLHGNQREISGGQQNVQDAYNKLDQITVDFGKKNNVDATKLQACIKAQSDTIVKASMAEGDKLNINATPTLFINGERVEGAMDADDLRLALNSQLKAAGVEPPPAPAKAAQTQPPAKQ
ncbi:MAG TPA: thioredoxin domain-containing protein [Verrucomicrobiae bacterium]|nr:thioredoxin domain-containing protein [Verrucomicrobiae bacterium]